MFKSKIDRFAPYKDEANHRKNRMSLLEEEAEEEQPKNEVKRIIPGKLMQAKDRK